MINSARQVFFAFVFVMLISGSLCQADPLWTQNSAPLLMARGLHCATLLPNGMVLVTGGEQGFVATGTAELYDPAKNMWTSAGTLTAARFQPTATLLTNGKVLVTGGVHIDNETQEPIPVPQSELYDPATNSWSTGGTLNTARFNQTATLLPNGKVLVVGGIGQSGSVLKSAELYGPGTNAWSNAASMNTARFAHTSTLLANGEVLVVAGALSDHTYTSSAELYDPAGDTWSSAGSLSTPRGFHSATLLPGGKVVVDAGIDNTNSAMVTVEIYDPTANSWAPAADAYVARYNHKASLLPSGQVLLAGGDDTFGSAVYASAEIYDPPTNTWLNGGGIGSGLQATYRDSHTVTLLATGQVLIAGGHIGGTTLTSTAVGSPAVSNWRIGSALTRGHRYANSTLLPNGKVLLSGGYGFGGPELLDPATSVWTAAGVDGPLPNLQSSTLTTDGKVLVVGGGIPMLYDATENTWTSAASPTSQRVFHSATLLANGDVLIAGGFDPNNATGNLDSAERYSPQRHSWSSAGTLGVAREGHTATLLANGNVLVAGGDSGSVLAAAELYDAASNSWVPTASMGSRRAGHTATLLPSGRVLVAGGYNNVDRALATCTLYDPLTGTWMPAGALNVAREGHTATLLPNGTVLVSGGAGGDGTINSAELYDPIANAWTNVGYLSIARADHSATLLLDGTVLVSGGDDHNFASLSSTEVFDTGLVPQPTRQPMLSVPSLLVGNSNIVATGAGFRPNLEGSGGDLQGSTSNHPSIQVRRLDNGQIEWLTPESTIPFSDTEFVSTAAALAAFPQGHVVMTVFVNGIPSAAKMTVFDPTLQIFKNGFE